MSIIQKLTLAHLKRNKGRTVVTILGICVSVAMITAVFVCIASFMNYMADDSLYNAGNFQARVTGVTQNEVAELEAQDGVYKVGVAAELPHEKSGFKIDYGVSERTSSGSIFAADENGLSQIVTCDINGTLPKNSSEILVEQEFIDSNKLDWKVGDTVTIPVGTRQYIDNSEPRFITGPYIAGEDFVLNDIKEFKIAGIINENLPTRGYKIIRLAQPDELNNAVVYVELAKTDMNSYSELNQIMKSCNIDSSRYEYNTEYLSANFSFAADSSLAVSTVPMVAIILAVIIFASVALIYNAFGMSLSERTRYLGMLASVGATKAQKSSSVYFEGFLLGLVGIPVGIGAGILGIYITLETVGSRIQETGLINGGDNIKLSVIVPLWAIIGIIIVSAFTIFISAMIPARKASSVTPIAALKQSDEIKLKSKKLKSSKLIRAIFGYEGELANKNLKRNGRKSRVITASIALSIILFLSVNAFCDMFVKANDLSNDLPYQVYASVGNQNEYDIVKEDASSLTGIDDIYSATNLYFRYGGDSAVENLNTNQDVADKSNLTSSYSKLFDDNLAYINFIDDEDFNQLCKNNSIDYKEYYEPYGENDKEVRALLMNNVSHDGKGGEAFTDNILGEMFYSDQYDENGNKLTVSENVNLKAVVTGFVDYDSKNYVCNLNPATTISLYVPLSMYVNYCESIGIDAEMTVAVETQDSEKATKDIEDIIDENNLSGAVVIDIEKTTVAMNTLIFCIQVFFYGFAALITLISVANIINTVSTGIDLRRKEFAMYKSVGITPGGFNKMICMESLFYGLKALIFGIPISILLSLAMYLLLQSGNIPFTINIPLYLIVAAVVFLIVGASMFFAVFKLKNDSIVETLKEDIC